MKIQMDTPPKGADNEHTLKINKPKHKQSGGLFPLNSFKRGQSRMGEMKRRGKMMDDGAVSKH